MVPFDAFRVHYLLPRIIGSILRGPAIIVSGSLGSAHRRRAKARLLRRPNMASNSRRDDDKDDGRAENIELADSSATLAERLAKERDDMRMGWTPWFKEKMRRGDGETNGLENVTSNEELLRGEDGENAGGEAGGEVVWRVYKRRWFGLVQLVLLNVVVSWDVSSFSIQDPSAPVACL